jgi:hypothetical protein
MGRYGSLSLLLVLLATGLTVRAQPGGNAGGTKSFEDLLKEANMTYQTIKPQGGGVYYKIPVEVQGETTMVIATEMDLVENVKVVRMFCLVTPLPDNFKASPALLKKVADMNYNIPMGTIGLGQSDIMYSTGAWLRGMDQTTMGWQLGLCHAIRGLLKKELTPYLEEK